MTGSAHRGREEAWGAAVVLALLLLFLARAPLSASFWLDETISAWIITGSGEDVARRATIYQGQSPFYYLLLWAAAGLTGHGELGLRLLSLACGAAGLVVVYQLGVRLGGERLAGLAAAAALLCMNSFQDAVLSARPYALGFVSASASILLLLQLRERFTRARACLFVLACIVTLYAHFLFAVIFLAHAWHILRCPELRRRILPWAIGALVCALPLVPQASNLFSRGGGLVFASSPSLMGLLGGAVPVPAAVAGIVGITLALVWGGRLAGAPWRRASWAFLVPYIVLPVALFGVTVLWRGGSMWVPRYWMWQSAPWAALLGSLLLAFQDARSRRIALSAAACFFALRLLTQVRHLEDWRGAAHEVASAQGTIGLYTGLIEVESGSGGTETEFSEYVRAPLSIYGVTAPIAVIAASRADRDVQQLPANTDYLVVMNRRLGDTTSREVIEAAAKGAGLELEPLRPGQLVTAYRARKRS